MNAGAMRMPKPSAPRNEYVKALEIANEAMRGGWLNDLLDATQTYIAIAKTGNADLPPPPAKAKLGSDDERVEYMIGEATFGGYLHKLFHAAQARCVEDVVEDSFKQATSNCGHAPVNESAAQPQFFGLDRELPPPVEGVKYDEGKARWDLLPWEPMGDVVSVMTYGSKKYAPDNWKLVPQPERRYFAAAMRHLQKHRLGETHDGDGQRHLACAVCDLLFLIHFEQQAEVGG